MNSRIRLLVLFLVLGAASGAYFYFSPSVGINAPNSNTTTASVDKSDSLKLDEELKANIRHYFEGVTLEPKENDLNHAIQLDHSVGRPQMVQGKHKEAFRTYQKVLAISYHQGNLMGVGIGVNVLASFLERMNDKPEALRAALLAYKIAKVMNNKEEYGVAELQLARLLKDTDLAASMTLLARAKESLKGTRYKEDYTRLLPDLAGGLSKIGKREQAGALYAEAWDSAQSLGNAPTQKFAKWEVALHYGDSLMNKKEYEKAIGILEKARSFFSEAEKDVENYSSILHRLARAHAHTKDKAQAKRYFLSAYANYEKTRAAALGEKSLAKLDKSAKDLVDELVEFHIAAREYSTALALLESNKARTLDDIFGDPAYQDANKLERNGAAPRRGSHRVIGTQTRRVGSPSGSKSERRFATTIVVMEETIGRAGNTSDGAQSSRRGGDQDVNRRTY